MGRMINPASGPNAPPVLSSGPDILIWNRLGWAKPETGNPKIVL
jgi:hypothetical protein